MVFASCSGIKVVDSWKADEIGALANEKILVIARSDDMVRQTTFRTGNSRKIKGWRY